MSSVRELVSVQTSKTTFREVENMKVWTISILLLLLICLTIPFVTADKPGGDIGKVKKTPATVEIKPVDSLAWAKVNVGWEADTDVVVSIEGRTVAKLPDGSDIIDITPTKECLSLYNYGSTAWKNCEAL
jgi:hypothetical protein